MLLCRLISFFLFKLTDLFLHQNIRMNICVYMYIFIHIYIYMYPQTHCPVGFGLVLICIRSVSHRDGNLRGFAWRRLSAESRAVPLRGRRILHFCVALAGAPRTRCGVALCRPCSASVMSPWADKCDQAAIGMFSLAACVSSCVNLLLG